MSLGGWFWDAGGMVGMEPGPCAGRRWQVGAAEPMWLLANVPPAPRGQWPLVGCLGWGPAPKGVDVVGQIHFSIPFPGECRPGELPLGLTLLPKLCGASSTQIAPLGNAVAGRMPVPEPGLNPAKNQLMNERCQSRAEGGLLCYWSGFPGCAKGQPGAALLFWETPRPGTSSGDTSLGTPAPGWEQKADVAAGRCHCPLQRRSGGAAPVLGGPSRGAGGHRADGCALPAGRASLHDKASLRIDQVRSEDQGWYECKVLMLDQQYDTFHNGSWVHLTVNGEPGGVAVASQGGAAASPEGCVWRRCWDRFPFDF